VHCETLVRETCLQVRTQQRHRTMASIALERYTYDGYLETQDLGGQGTLCNFSEYLIGDASVSMVFSAQYDK